MRLPKKDGRRYFSTGTRWKGCQGNSSGPFIGPFGVVAREAEDVFVGETKDRLEGTLSAHRVEEFEHGVFALPANDVVDVFGVERGVGIDGREVAAPYDLDVRMQTTDLA